jgi:nitrite reductase/ring-hydroxylating ferredoxin subunit
MADIQCGPPTWRLPTCATCTEGGKTYVYTKFVEAAIAKLHESLKGLTDPLAEVQAMTLLLGEPHVQSKQWQEQGEKSPEITATYCWKPIKAEAIKPLADKRYGLGSYYDGHCKVDADSCYHFTMDCRKQRNEKEYICNPSLQEFRAKDGKCVDSPRAHACDCQPSVYWKCGPGGGKAGAAAKAGRPAKGRGKR